LTIPLLDSQRRIIALLGGMPRDLAAWKVVTDGAAACSKTVPLVCASRKNACTTVERKTAFLPWPADGRTAEPGELQNNTANTQVTDELLAHEFFQRIARFATILFAMWAPVLFAFYRAQMALLATWKPSMRPNFARGIFAACTFNFGPHAICVPHLDFANLSWGWCSITALGDFDPDLGGHLILWDLRLIIRFPPGSTILIPSALIRHSNVPIRPHEHRSSFVQYTAGGLFRWVRNGFKTDEDWHNSASRKEKAAREAENQGRWEQGMKMFSSIDEL
ncbi:hypothetical protein DFH09DRAFT_1102819, partial [Mycena vulgaris]